MNIKNLERAKEISGQLPALEQARSLLSKSGTTIQVIGAPQLGSSHQESVKLPKSTSYNILAVLNSEINLLKEEVENL